MLGPNPRRAAAAAAVAAASPDNGAGGPKTTLTAPGAGNGLMVKAIDEIFRHVEAAENPSAYRVSDKCDENVYPDWAGIRHCVWMNVVPCIIMIIR